MRDDEHRRFVERPLKRFLEAIVLGPVRAISKAGSLRGQRGLGDKR